VRLVVHGVRGYRGEEAEDDSDDDWLAEPRLRLAGAAALALLPSGVLSGHFVPSSGGGASLGLIGRPLAAPAPDPCRDADQVLYRLTLINYAPSRELGAWAQRTGGDLFSLEPPDPDDGDAAAAMAADQLPLEEGAEEGGGGGGEGGVGEGVGGPAVHFAGRTLHDGPEAEARLQRLNPALRGRGAVVCEGECVLEGLPPWFLAPAAR
jgi:hypothetical protein